MLSYDDCPARFAFGMRRHTEAGEAPEATSPDNAYGSAVHDALSALGEGASDDEAVRVAWNRWGSWLDVEHLDQLVEDVETYHRRDYAGYIVLANETEIEIPLVEWDGVRISFRARIDRLVAHPGNPTVGIHTDYKSSAHRKSETDVHEDKQLWAYNWAIHEFWPELQTLVQRYDQLRFGVETTRKNADQRRQIKQWLAAQAIRIYEDKALDPKFNQWCPWCPLLESCGVVRELSDWATSRLVALAPPSKIGRKTIIELDPDLIGVYLDQLDAATRARQVLERFEKSIRGALRDMPADERARRGFTFTEPRSDVFTTEALRAAHDVLGPDFYELVNLTKRALEGYDDEGKANAVLAMAESVVGSARLKKIT